MLQFKRDYALLGSKLMWRSWVWVMLAASIAVAEWSSSPAIAEDSGFRADYGSRIVGYLPDYRIEAIAIDPLKPLTDLIYFGGEMSKNGTCDWTKIEKTHLEKLLRIRQQTDCRLLLCIGGWGRSEGFAMMSQAEDSRSDFIGELEQFCLQNKFDGVDYDWEHPTTPQEIQNYAKLVSETKAVFSTHGWSVSVAQAVWQDLGTELYNAVDAIHLMSYDHAYPQSTMDKSINDVVRLQEWGCESQKIILGVPFYGRSVDRQTKTYRQLIADSNRDGSSKFAFNDRPLIKQKVAYIADQNLGGIMIWEVGQDSVVASESLLRLIDETMASHSLR